MYSHLDLHAPLTISAVVSAINVAPLIWASCSGASVGWDSGVSVESDETVADEGSSTVIVGASVVVAVVSTTGSVTSSIY